MKFNLFRNNSTVRLFRNLEYYSELQHILYFSSTDAVMSLNFLIINQKNEKVLLDITLQIFINCDSLENYSLFSYKVWKVIFSFSKMFLNFQQQ